MLGFRASIKAMAALVLTAWLFGCASQPANVRTSALVTIALPTSASARASTIVPTATQVPAVAMLEPTAILFDAPTHTAEPPTATPVPTNSPTPTPPASPTPPPYLEITDSINPLTGYSMGDAGLLDHRPIAVKISNSPSIVRPQAGLGQADLVFEHYVEGGVTRFTAVFHGETAPLIGSVRSSRLIDIEIAAMFDASMAYSTANDAIDTLLLESAVGSYAISPGLGDSDSFFRRSDLDVAREHTLFTDTDRLRNLLSARGQDGAPQIENGWLFSAEPTSPAPPINKIWLSYPRASVYWEHDPSSNLYLRQTDNTPHFDGNTGQQLAFSNVIVVYADHQDSQIVQDRFGNISTAIEVYGQQQVTLFRDGVRLDGYWQRFNARDSLSFFLPNGDPMPLAVGKSFIQIVPLDFTALLTSAE